MTTGARGAPTPRAMSPEELAVVTTRLPGPELLLVPEGDRFLGLPLPPYFETDVFTVRAGLRHLGKFEEVRDPYLPHLLGRIEALGLLGLPVAGPRPRESVVFIARDAAVLEEARRLELEQREQHLAAGRREAARALGELLGYPECCVDAFTATVRHRDSEGLVRLGSSAAGRIANAPDPLMNFFPRHLSPVGFLPCRLDCPEALARGERVAAAMEALRGVPVEAMRRALTSVVLWSSGPFFLMFLGAGDLDDTGFSYDGVCASSDIFILPDVLQNRRAFARLGEQRQGVARGRRVALDDGGATIVDAQGRRVHRWDTASIHLRMLAFGVR